MSNSEDELKTLHNADLALRCLIVRYLGNTQSSTIFIKPKGRRLCGDVQREFDWRITGNQIANDDTISQDRAHQTIGGEIDLLPTNPHRSR
jgi:hypothetical protein